MDFAVKSGADCIIIDDFLCNLADFHNMVKTSRNVLTEIEQMEDTLIKYYEGAK